MPRSSTFNLPLILVKSVHSVIFVFMSICVLYVLYAALTRTYNVWLLVALLAVTLESIVYFANGRRCPLTQLARRYGDDTGDEWVVDLFLPRRCVPLIVPVCGFLFVAGVLVLLVNALLLLR
jgi:hypothetical protein